MKINNEFELGQTVYLKTDPDQYQRMVIKLSIGINNDLMYGVSCGPDFTWHYEEELYITKNVLITR